MAENSGDLSLGYMMGQSENNRNGFFGGDGGWLGLIVLALLFGWGGNGGGLFGNGGGNMNAGFAWQNIDGGIRAIQNGISDATYALNNTIVNGFHGVDNQLCGLSRQMSECCCDIKQTINNSTREVLDFLVNDKMSTLQNENQALKFQASQTAQNAFITANQEAQTAELIRRLGADCPTPAYVVQPPTPVTFPTNNCGCGCGNAYGYGYAG